MSTANTAAGFISGTGFSSQCFPVRSLTRRQQQDEDGEFWSVLRVALDFVAGPSRVKVCDVELLSDLNTLNPFDVQYNRC